METVTVSEFAENLGITSEAVFVGTDRKSSGDEFDQDNWKVTLSRKSIDGRKKLTVDFHMGIGHNGKAPDTKRVLDCLISDAQAVDPDYCRGFDDFCANFGYDTDSRKAEKIYKACWHIAGRLERFLGRDNYQKAFEVERL